MLFFLIGLLTQPAEALSRDELESCILMAIKTVSPEMTIGELKAQCEKKIAFKKRSSPSTRQKNLNNDDQEYAFSKRLIEDDENALRPFTLMAHKPNYILLGTYNNDGFDPTLHQEQYDDSSMTFDKIESQFQLSFKFPLVINFLNKNIDLFAAYTNLSFWQVYNDELSSPFRETNHEPEAWVQFKPEGFEKFGIKNTWNRIGYVHQSNGQGGVLSRSWNRIYFSMLFEKDNFTLSIKPWIRIPEGTETDDNPDITDYLGHFHIRMGYKYEDHTFSLMLRNNLESGFSKGSIEAGWSFPLWKYDFIKGYIHYFSGYGQSLIDYDHYVNSIGFGILLTDIL